MKRLGKIIRLGLGLAVLVLSFVLGGAAANALTPPPPPPWVQVDGSVDLSKLPSCFEQVGRDGKTVLDATGLPVCIPAVELFRAPPSGPGPIEQQVPPSRKP